MKATEMNVTPLVTVHRHFYEKPTNKTCKCPSSGITTFKALIALSDTELHAITANGNT